VSSRSRNSRVPGSTIEAQRASLPELGRDPIRSCCIIYAALAKRHAGRSVRRRTKAALAARNSKVLTSLSGPILTPYDGVL